MKKILFTMLVASSVLLCKAQDKNFSLSVGPVVSSASGDFSNGYGLGFGAEVQATYPIAESFEAFAQAGYQSFSGKSVTTFPGITVSNPSIGHIPFLVGARYKQEGGFIGGLGIGFGSYSGGSQSQSGFTFSPQVGYNISKFDLLLHYTSSSVSGVTLSYFGIKVYYKIF